MKKLIVTRADDGIKEMAEITHPFLKAYAEKCGADFKVFEPIDYPVHKYHYRIMQLREMLEDYDRALSIDSDVLICHDCPNIFDKVPETHIATVFEDVGTRRSQRRGLIGKIQKRWGNVGWESGYMNTGFALFSKCHREIFNKIENTYWDGFGYDDLHLMYQAKKMGFPIHELPYWYNTMTLFCEKWNNSPSRFDSYVIHYAGVGVFIPKFTGSRLNQIRHDAKKLKEIEHGSIQDS